MKNTVILNPGQFSACLWVGHLGNSIVVLRTKWNNEGLIKIQSTNTLHFCKQLSFIKIAYTVYEAWVNFKLSAHLGGGVNTTIFIS